MALFNFGKKKEEEKKTPACASLQLEKDVLKRRTLDIN